MCWNLHQPHLQQVGMMQIPANHVGGIYGLWMRIKGPNNHMVMALGLCVMWPLVLNLTCNKTMSSRI